MRSEKPDSFYENVVFPRKTFRISRRVLHGGIASANRCMRCRFIIESGHMHALREKALATSFPIRAADSVSDSVCHSCSCFRCVRRSVSTCPPRGNLVDGLPRAPSGL